MELLSKTGEVVIPGLLFVFIALIILIGSVEGVGRLLSRAAARAAAKPGNGAGQAGAPPAPAAAGVPAETVAAIAAAVACVMEETSPGVPYTVASVSRAGGGRGARPVWGFAGMQQNTRPF
jgi:sodium pump decarboxylase gamma subunit